MKTLTLIHYGELTLKGKNRKYFEEQLIKNIYDKCGGSLHRYRGYLVMEGGNPENLRYIFGISWFANVLSIEKDIDALKGAIIEKVKDGISSAESFAVYTKRADKEFTHTSMKVSELVGDEIVKHYNKKVDLKNPDFPIYIEISDKIYVYFKKNKGLGGLPVGISGKVLCLLSGGIDSPVAAYLMNKRGCYVDYVHFHVFPDNDRVLETKIKLILESLRKYENKCKVFLVPYKQFERAILKGDYLDGNELILFRRFMFKTAERISQSYGYSALVSGDSLGQVASQTLDNLKAVRNVVALPIFQPLISYDKQEIIDLSKKIGTYETSIQKYKDCCSLISRNPRTRANIKQVRKIEEIINIEDAIDKTLRNMDVVNL